MKYSPKLILLCSYYGHPILWKKAEFNFVSEFFENFALMLLFWLATNKEHYFALMLLFWLATNKEHYPTLFWERNLWFVSGCNKIVCKGIGIGNELVNPHTPARTVCSCALCVVYKLWNYMSYSIVKIFVGKFANCRVFTE